MNTPAHQDTAGVGAMQFTTDVRMMVPNRKYFPPPRAVRILDVLMQPTILDKVNV